MGQVIAEELKLLTHAVEAGGGTPSLAPLSNGATAAQILSGYEAYGDDAVKITGSYTPPAAGHTLTVSPASITYQLSEEDDLSDDNSVRIGYLSILYDGEAVASGIVSTCSDYYSWMDMSFAAAEVSNYDVSNGWPVYINTTGQFTLYIMYGGVYAEVAVTAEAYEPGE